MPLTVEITPEMTATLSATLPYRELVLPFPGIDPIGESWDQWQETYQIINNSLIVCMSALMSILKDSVSKHWWERSEPVTNTWVVSSIHWMGWDWQKTHVYCSKVTPSLYTCVASLSVESTWQGSPYSSWSFKLISWFFLNTAIGHCCWRL